MMPELEPERVYEAIRQGVRDAMWDMIAHATDTPCADFYEAIQAGVERALLRRGPEIMIKLSDPP